MAFSTNNGPNTTLAEINVTPLVDVMLVLLIIFMISAPLMQSGVTLELPEGNQSLAQKQNHLVLSIAADGRHYLNDKYLKPQVLIENIKVELANSPDQTVYLRGDVTLTYGKVMEMLNELKAAGIEKVSLVTEPTASRQG